MSHKEPHYPSAWLESFSPEQRAEQLQGDKDAWYGIIGLLLGIATMGVALGICTVLGIAFLT